MKNILSLFIACILAGSLVAQPANIPYHFKDVNVKFNIYDGNKVLLEELDEEEILIRTQEYNQERDRNNNYKPGNTTSPYYNPVYKKSDYLKLSNSYSVRNAPFIQLHFGNTTWLGKNSYLKITSHFDGDVQYFNHASLNEWSNHSAFFKGSGVDIELFVAPNDNGITAGVTRVLVGEFLGNDANAMRSQCGPNDDRVQSSIANFDARLMPLGCTGWNTAAGFYLTAGHCLNVSSGSLQIAEFDVPASLPNGTTQPAAVNDQYPIIYSSRVFQDAGIGDDWGIYDCGANSNTGLTPHEGRRAYYHLSKDASLATTNIQIRGYGTDDVPLGTTGFRNADNQTRQWHSGPYVGETTTSVNDIFLEYQTDTEGGNSGSAIRPTSSLMTALGIHSHAGCDDPLIPNDGNHGTSFEANDTENAMNVFWQSQAEFVDVDHHLSSTVGTTVLPHFSVQNAVNQANAGHGPAISALELIMIAGSNDGSGGVYAETFSYSGATNGVLLRRTVGAVKIGPNATARPARPINNSNENGGGQTNVIGTIKNKR